MISLLRTQMPKISWPSDLITRLNLFRVLYLAVVALYVPTVAWLSPDLLKLSFIFLATGCLLECTFTGLSELYEAGCDQIFYQAKPKQSKERLQRLKGYFSLHYFPLYAMLLPVTWILTNETIIHFLIEKQIIGWVGKHALLGLMLIAGEYVGMRTLEYLWGKSPAWFAYRDKPDNIHNAIRKSYLPAFCVMAIIFSLVKAWMLPGY